MAREKGSLEELIRAGGKVRKRGCSSSSSSSSILQNVKLKRAILARKRAGGSSTPVPTWKMSSETPGPVTASPYQVSYASKSSVPVSARKLAATLWELQEIPSFPAKAKGKRSSHNSRNGDPPKDKTAAMLNSHSLPVHLSDPSHSPSSLTTDRSGTGSLRRQIAMLTQRNGSRRKAHGSMQHLRSPSNGSSMEIDTRVFTPSSSLLGPRMKSGESNHNFNTSTELLKILNRIWSLEEQRTSSVSLASALRAELEHARARIHELIQEQRADRHQIDHLMKKLAEQRAICRSKEQEKLTVAIESSRNELEVERKLRRRMEALNKKLSRELEDTKGSLAKALQNFERERKARELMEEVCDELAREIGQDKAKVEELKRESVKVWEEVEEERKMLQMAEVWREERVQMKLAEARLELEEKNTTLDKLRKELEAFLKAKRANDFKSDVPNHSTVGETDMQSESVVPLKESKTTPQGIEDDDDSADSDLHSIELNKETLEDNTRAYRWSYASSARSREPKARRSEHRISLEGSKDWGSCEHASQVANDYENSSKSLHGNKTHIEDRIKSSIPIDRDRDRDTEDNEWDFTSSSQWIERSIEPWGDCRDHTRLSRNSSEGIARDETRRLKPVSSGKDHVTASTNGSSSPIRQWNHHWHSSDSGSTKIGRQKGISDPAKGSQESAYKAKLMESRKEIHHTHPDCLSSFEYQ
eukprot:TRINITY_DN17545_c0_g1_i1.p1 TRINITY_DN17545_c0_g1~~TRINITY_DN17545_c0_g1_i1.p1  ORF type:complete len:719 (+),score=143.26 TRINITY_DN17545_c0_g1_i1:49-2157(+)